jgi:hypothetical protein
VNAPATYMCNYCGTPHDWATRSEEHVVPRKLLNAGLVLPDVCNFWNNFFARAFETAVCDADFVREILLALTPPSERPRKAIRLGTVQTARQTTEERWLVGGQEILRPKLARRATNVLTIDAFDDLGSRHPIDVQLPFNITAGGTADDHELDRFRGRIADEHQRIFEYIRELARDPTIDPALAVQLKGRGLHLREPKAVEAEETLVERVPGGPVSDILPNEYPLDVVVWRKFYMKVAWCFACLKLGRDVLVSLDGDSVLGYVQSDAVPGELVDEVRRLDGPSVTKLFRSASLGGKPTWLWRESAAATDSELGSLPASVSALVAPLAVRRLASERLAASWASMKTATLERPLGLQHRSHSLRLRTEIRGIQAAIACDIGLFGGLLSATVQLTPSLPVEQLEGFEEASETIAF